MPKAHLTPEFCDVAVCVPGERKTDYFDAVMPGFMLEVRLTGGKRFINATETSTVASVNTSLERRML